MAKLFSKNFCNFVEWAAQAAQSEYKNRIKRLHILYPEASLSQLRGHAKGREVPLQETKKRAPSKLLWSELTPEEQGLRIQARSVYRNMKRYEISLAMAAKEERISPAIVLRHLDGFKKLNGKWVSKEWFSNEVPMLINSHGNSLNVIISDSRTASAIGGYHAAVRQFLESGDPAHLIPYHGKVIKATDGSKHVLDTDPESLYEIQESREEEEFYSIYRG